MFLSFHLINNEELPIILKRRSSCEDIEIFPSSQIDSFIFSLLRTYRFVFFAESTMMIDTLKTTGAHFSLDDHFICINKSYLSFLRQKEFPKSALSFNELWHITREKLLST